MTAPHRETDVFFVLGAPKSGTTWLQKLLDAHPQLSCMGEGKFLFLRGRLMEAMAGYSRFLQANSDAVFGERLFPVVGAEEFERMFAACIELRVRHAASAGARRIGCKDPEFGLYMASMTAIFPRARYLHLVRDPRDVAVSGWAHAMRTDSRAAENPPDLGQVAARSVEGWARYVRGVQDAAAAGLACRQIRYEDLLASPAETLGEALEFLEVSTQAQIVADCLRAASFERATGGRPPGQADEASFYRKGVAGDWRNHFGEAQGRALLAATGGLAQALGYR